MEHFTPVSGLISGMMIGMAAVLFLAFNGRIAGISGVLGCSQLRGWWWASAPGSAVAVPAAMAFAVLPAAPRVPSVQPWYSWQWLR